MTPAAFAVVILYGAGVATSAAGALMALTAAATPKRVMGLAFAFAGATLVAAGLGASTLALAAAAAGVGAALVGGAIAARLHETFDTSDWGETVVRSSEEDVAQ